MMKRNRLAFTMAEILLSLTIIGVVAVITLPSLTGNINERTWNTQRKALYARFSQALALMPSLNGYGKLTAEVTDEDGSITQSAQDTAAEAFLTEGLSKVMKINNICDNEHLADCGIPSKIIPMNGDVISISDIKTLRSLNAYFTSGSAGIPLDIKAAAFETQNGESIIVYYNPNCKGNINKSTYYYSQPLMCANFVYDLNGNKGPNTVGKDIGFITALYPTDPLVIAPRPSGKGMDTSQLSASAECTKQNNNTRLPSIEELMSMFYNKKLIGGRLSSSMYILSGSVISSETAWMLYVSRNTVGACWPFTRSTGGHSVQCIER